LSVRDLTLKITYLFKKLLDLFLSLLKHYSRLRTFFSTLPSNMLTLALALTLLLVLISVVKLNPYLSLILTAIFAGLMQKMPLLDIVSAVKKGIGDTLAGLVLTLTFGVMLGSVLSESGAAQRISSSLIKAFGQNRVKYAIAFTGFLVGIAMFYNAGFLILLPLLFSVVRSTGLPLIYLGIAMASALSVTHGFLPPHPGPIAIANIFKANVGLTLLYGFSIAIPAIILAGIIFPEFIKNIKASAPEGLFETKPMTESEMPSFAMSFLAALCPVILMATATVAELTLPHDSPLLNALKFIGDPNVSLILSVFFALFVLGVLKGANVRSLLDKSTASLGTVTMVLLILGAGGAFKEIIIKTGISQQITGLFVGSTLSPLVLAWLIATFVRVCLGSATIAGLTAAGIVEPLVASSGVSPELMVLAIGAGSLMLSHVNDSGFWVVKEYFGLSLKDTFKTWTVMETIVGIVGLIGVLVLERLFY
jgi:Gnt-I system high-affinity gluconate transporter